MGMMVATTATGAGGRFGCSAVTSGGSAAAGILYEVWVFSGAPASSPRSRRISYSGVSMFGSGTRITSTPHFSSMARIQSRFLVEQVGGDIHGHTAR